jgi:hypothetical protein
LVAFRGEGRHAFPDIQAVFFAGVLIAAGLWQATPASAQSKEQLNWCLGKDGATPDLRIGGCTAVIQSGKYSGKNLAFAFVNRGLGYKAKDDYDRAKIAERFAGYGVK